MHLYTCTQPTHTFTWTHVHERNTHTHTAHTLMHLYARTHTSTHTHVHTNTHKKHTHTEVTQIELRGFPAFLLMTITDTEPACSLAYWSRLFEHPSEDCLHNIRIRATPCWLFYHCLFPLFSSSVTTLSSSLPSGRSFLLRGLCSMALTNTARVVGVPFPLETPILYLMYCKVFWVKYPSTGDHSIRHPKAFFFYTSLRWFSHSWWQILAVADEWSHEMAHTKRRFIS